MALQTNAFNKLYISSTGVESPNSYVEVKNIFNAGNLGKSFNMIATSSLSDGVDRELKGTLKVSSFPLVLNYDQEDAGQQDLKDAGEDETNTLYYFRFEYNDADGGDPSTWTFQGKVNGFEHVGGGANEVKKVNAPISIEMDTLELVEAT